MRFARLFVVAVLLPLLRAGPPFLTDDPEPVDLRHWEAYLFAAGDRTADGNSVVGPAAEFNYGALPGENELRAIDSMREVYGIRAVRFDHKRRTVCVEYDASRMKQDAVARLLRNAGIDVREAVALA